MAAHGVMLSALAGLGGAVLGLSMEEDGGVARGTEGHVAATGQGTACGVVGAEMADVGAADGDGGAMAADVGDERGAQSGVAHA